MGWGDKAEERTSTFVWGKKMEKEGLKNLSRKEIEQLNKRKKQENLEELEKLKKRRLEREAQRQEREDEMYQQQRAKEAAQFDVWQKQEETFHLEQARLRSKIRIQDGRAKPIDLLAQYISEQNLEESIEMQMHEPYAYIVGLKMDDLEDLLVDIKVYNELEKGSNADFWNDITIIVDDDLKKLKKIETENAQFQGGRREGIHQSVAQDVSQIFRGKTTTQLNELRNKIEDKLSSKSDGIDIGYWESLLSQLKAHMARARLRDRHQDNLKMKLEMLKREQEEILIKKEDNDNDDDDDGDGDVDGENEDDKSSNKTPISSHSNSPRPSSSKDHLTMTMASSKIMMSDTDESSQDASSSAPVDLLEECFKLYERGNYSPKYLKPCDFESGYDIITEEENKRRLDAMRQKVIQEEEEDETIMSRQDMSMRNEARKGMNDDEVEFSVETKLDPQIYLWSDKYRPRKPRYFNRVHTGFEWNKYNQTHYDIDNPPPKIVQGYKFNIFYPDLINKGATPQYYLTPCSDNHDFAILKFHSGPPYEDIAFKIVNREWEYSYKRGFRCQFQNNIFQLWFHFKRYRYRR
jgi:hypothetical protein